MMDVTLVQALVLDLNIVELQGPSILIQACATLVLGINIFRILFAFEELIQNPFILVLPKHYQLIQAYVVRVCKVAWEVSSLVEICLTLHGSSS